jgi:glycosyltransferase involved in cell wall biosynthesis
MKVLSVTISPPGEDAQWWRISNMAKLLRSEQVEVDIIHYIIKGSESHKRLNEMKQEKLNNGSFTIASPISIILKHLEKLNHRNYDIVYGNTYAGTFFSSLGKLKRIPLICDMHGIPEEMLLDRESGLSNFFVGKMMSSFSLSFSNRIICVSKKMIEYLHEEKRVPIKKLTFINNGVDLDFFKPIKNKFNKIRKQLGVDNKFVFGYVGGFQKWQGIENFIKAASKINDKNVRFLIVGGTKSIKEKNFIYVPKVSRLNIPYYYNICDVLVLPRPSHIVTEVAAPTKFSEYAAMGKPILTTDVGDAADLVRKYRNGIVVKNSHAEVLEKGIIEFFKMDKQELDNMSERSRMLAEKELDWKISSNNLLNCLNEVSNK